MHRLPVLYLVLFIAAGALAQARPDCLVQPHTLAAMRGSYRPLLVFAPTGSDPRFRAQVKELDAAANDMMDRKLMLMPVLEHAAGYQAPLDAPTAMLAEEEQAKLRRCFHIAPGGWKAVLIGEDGAAKQTGA